MYLLNAARNAENYSTFKNNFEILIFERTNFFLVKS